MTKYVSAKFEGTRYPYQYINIDQEAKVGQYIVAPPGGGRRFPGIAKIEELTDEKATHHPLKPYIMLVSEVMYEEWFQYNKDHPDLYENMVGKKQKKLKSKPYTVQAQPNLGDGDMVIVDDGDGLRQIRVGGMDIPEPRRVQLEEPPAIIPNEALDAAREEADNILEEIRQRREDNIRGREQQARQFFDPQAAEEDFENNF